jgi:hypothetical protein
MSNTGVGFGDAEGFRWDWSSTTHAYRPGLLDRMLAACGAHTVDFGKGAQGWQQSRVAYDRDGYAVARVYVGGRDDLQVVASSATAHAVRRAALAVDPEGKTARVDTRINTLATFEHLADLATEVGEAYGSKVGFIEYKRRGVSLGRTVMIGAPSSAVRVRVYEKWLESPGEYVEGTNRVEVQLRPPSLAKGFVSSWGPEETFAASKVTQRLAEALTGREPAVASLHVRRGTPDIEQSIEHMGKQYARSVGRLLEHNGGDVGVILGHLGL